MCSHFTQLEKNKGTYIRIFNPLLELHMSGSVTTASFQFVQYICCPLQWSGLLISFVCQVCQMYIRVFLLLFYIYIYTFCVFQIPNNPVFIKGFQFGSQGALCPLLGTHIPFPLEHFIIGKNCL